MNIVVFLSELKERDIRLKIVGENLNVDAPKGTLSPELWTTLRQHKAELIATLRAANNPSPEPSPTTPPLETPSDLARLIQAMGEYWHYSVEDFETAYEGAQTDPTAWRVLCLEDQRRFGWPAVFEQAVNEAAEPADRITQLARVFYNHLFGPGVRTGCCHGRVGRYCAEGTRLRDAYQVGRS